MASKETEFYNHLFDSLTDVKLSRGGLSEPDPRLDNEVAKIFTQAHEHRNRLVSFYIWYTIAFTVFVLGLIGWQAYMRVDWHDSNFTIIPQWGLNLLVTGMFAQFIGLLTIVTQRVWDFKPFFAYHSQMKHHTTDDHEDNQAKDLNP